MPSAFERDALRTFATGSTRLRFEDHSTVTLTENSLVFIRRHDPATAPAPRHEIEVQLGQADVEAVASAGRDTAIDIVVGEARGRARAAESGTLHGAIQQVLEAAIADRGTTFHTYRDLLGEKGRYQHHLAVFHRQGQPCPRCGTPVERLTLASRDTHLCPHCQALPTH